MTYQDPSYKPPTSATNEMSVGPSTKSDPRHQMTDDSAATKLLPSILVVEDDPSVLEMLHDALDLWGFDVFLAKNGREGMHVLATQKVDGILLDMDMPVMDGLTMLAELRQRECRARCVLVSAFLDNDVRTQARNLGVDRVMEKPIDVGALRRVMVELLPLSEEPPAKAAGC